MGSRFSTGTPLMGILFRVCLGTLLLTSVLDCAAIFSAAQNKESTVEAPAKPDFTENDALDLFDEIQATLQSYNRKKFLALFDSGRMSKFGGFRDQVNHLFDRYDSFTVTYHLSQTAMEGGNGIALADFGLDATSNSDESFDLRRHTQLRIVAAWNGKEWKIVELSPRAMFQ